MVAHRRLGISRCVALLFLLLVGHSQAAPYGEVAAAELARWLKGADSLPVVLDIRGRTAYQAGTIPGTTYAGANPAGFLPTGSVGPVVLLTSHPYDPSTVLAWVYRLANAGHRVHVLKGGMAAWQRARFTVETPEQGLTRPGTVPFVIPRGICENKKPIQVFR